MNKKIIAGAVLLIVLAGVSAAVVWGFWRVDPAVPAQGFLDRVAQGDFAHLEDYFSPEDQASARELGEAFQRFADAFALSSVTVNEFEQAAISRTEAVFNFTLFYESDIFESLETTSRLTVKRSNIFSDWLLGWAFDLPLEGYGTNVNYSRQRLDPRRGPIVDGAGRTLAGEGSLVAVGVQPDRIKDPEPLLTSLEEQLGLNPEYVRGQYQAPGVQSHWFVPLATLTEEEYRRLDPVLRPIPGIFFRRVESRAYPLESYAAHITGYLGQVSPEMIRAYPELDYISGEVVGRAGLENSQDAALRGLPGYRFYVEPEDGFKILVAEKPVVLGESIELTLDARMQEIACQIMGDRSGALVVLDAQSGAVLALASTPSYDPNEFSRGISSARWRDLESDPRRPLFSRALQGLYPPGSTFKVLTVAAALDLGLYEPESVFIDPGELTVHGNIIRNFQRQNFGEHDLHTAVVESINTTVAQVGLSLGAADFEDYFIRSGLHEAIDLGLPTVAGQVGTPGSGSVALAWSAIGQHEVLLTPLHMARFFAIFANEGKLPAVHLIKTGAERLAPQVFQAETVEQINAMLRDVVRQGTGSEAAGCGLEIYAKTGTAEITGGKEHAWFAGHVEMPPGRKLAFAVLIEEGGVGGRAAAPLIRDYFLRLQQAE